MKKIYALLACLCAIMFVKISRGQSGSTTVGVTIAGGNGVGSALNQVLPARLMLDPSGNLFVLDEFNQRITKYAQGSTQGVLVTGGNGPVAGPFTIDAAYNLYVANNTTHQVLKWAQNATQGIVVANTTNVDLRGLAVDGAGNLYALDYYGSRIIKYSPGSLNGETVLATPGLTAAGLSTGFPRAFFVDRPGNIYVTDDFAGRILKFNPVTGTTIVVAGGNGNGGAANQLRTPQGIYVNQQGDIYIADAGNNRIQKWAPEATSGITVAGGNDRGESPIQLSGPIAVWADQGGKLIVADLGNYRVQRFDILESPGSPAIGLTVAGGDGSILAAGVHVDAAGNIYVADAGNHRVQKYSQGSLAGVTVAGGNGAGPGANQLNTPKAVTVDAAGNIYIADQKNERVQKWAPGASTGITVAGGNGAGTATNQLSGPNDVFVDKNGNVYVCENVNDRITKWAPGATTGVRVARRNDFYYPTGMYVDNDEFIYVSIPELGIVEKWSNGTYIGNAAGTVGLGSGASKLFAPTGLFVDSLGTIYVADQGNHRIQKWAKGASSGITIAGGNGIGLDPTQLSYPNDVFVDATGDFYVATGGRVQKFSVNGLGVGLNYKYYEGAFNTLPDFNALTPFKTGVSTNVNLASRTQGRTSDYAFLWEGKIKIPAPGAYTFETVSDDGSRLYFNMQYAAAATPTVDNDGIHAAIPATGNVNIAAAGIYPIAISYFQKNDGQTMQLYWTGPGIPRQQIPDSAFVAASGDNSPPSIPANLHVVSKGIDYINLAWDQATDNLGVTSYDIYVDGNKKFTTTELQFSVGKLSPGGTYRFNVRANDFTGNSSDFSNTVKESTNTITTGLFYQYYQGTWNSLPDFFTINSFASGFSPNADISIRPQGRNDNYAFKWEGYINITTPGNYTFETVSDDGSRLYFNSKYSPTAVPTVDNDGLHAATSATGTVYIPAAGKYPVAITFFEKDGGENMELYWTGPGIPRQKIPDVAFSIVEQQVANLNYKYYEGDWTSLPDFSTLTPVKTGKTANADISIRPSGINDHFAFVWEGNINITVPGNYTFETVSDDGSKLYFNSTYSPTARPLVSNDGLHAANSAAGIVNISAAGIYPIAITYFEHDGGENMQVYWTGPGIDRQLIPDAAFVTSSSPASGLSWRYYEGNWNTLPDFGFSTAVKTGNSENIDINVRPTGKDDNFAFIWEGRINIPAAGTYNFETISDDGSRFYFNSNGLSGAVALVNNDGLHAPTSVTGSVYVPSAGSYPVYITYFEKDGGETMQLYWSGPGIPRQLVPNSAFAQPAGIQITTPDLTRESSQGVSTTLDISNKKTHITKVYPDPFIERFKIDFYNSSATNDITVTVRDLNGKTIHSQRAGKLAVGNNSINVSMSSSHSAPGVYFVTLQANGKIIKTLPLLKSTR